MIKQIVKQEEAKTFGEWGYIAIAKHFSKILKHESEVLEDKNPEELHQMRVGMRRLRSAMAGFASALDLPKTASDKSVGKVARILGELRDIDVLEDILKNHYQPNLPKKEQKQLNKVLKFLEKRRKYALNQVRHILNGQLYYKLKEGLENWLEDPTYQPLAAISINYVLPDLLLPQVSNLLLHPGWLVGVEIEAGEIHYHNQVTREQVREILDTQGEILHDLRKEAKRSRYQMELFTEFYQEQYQEYVNDIKEIQSVLGDIQDSYVLADFLGEVFDADLNNKVPSLANLLRETCYQKWQEWEKLQQKFLAQETRKQLQDTVQSPTAKETEAQKEEESNNHLPKQEVMVSEE